MKLLALALAAFAAPLHAGQTWVVDDDGGADFTDLPEALASPSVVDGDTLLLQPGSYGGLETSKALTVVGLGEAPEDVQLDSGLLTGVAGPFSLANVDVLGLTLVDCVATVSVGHSSLSVLSVVRSPDVRLEGVDSSTLRATEDSRLEASACELVQLVEVFGAGTEVRVARTDVRGQDGDDVGPFMPVPEDGSPAVRVQGGVATLLGGEGFLLEGGDGGFGDVCADDGSGGPAILVSGGAVRHSGYALEGGTGPDPFCPNFAQAPPVDVFAGTVTEAPTPDPVLERVGVPRPGGTVRLIARAAEGDTVVVFASLTPVQLDLPGWVGSLALVPDFLLASGVLDEGGSLSVQVALPALLPLGTVVHTQAFGLHPAGEPQRTSNAVTLVVH